MQKLIPEHIITINKCHITMDDIWTLDWHRIKPAEDRTPGPKDEQIAKQHEALKGILKWHDIEDDDGLRASLVCTEYIDLAAYDKRQAIISAGMSLAFVDILSEAGEMRCLYVLFSSTDGIYTAATQCVGSTQLPVLNDEYIAASSPSWRFE